MSEKWYQFLSPNLRPLALQSLQLLKKAQEAPESFDNYDYIVYPLAKAYECFLKDYLLAMNLIDRKTYASKQFAIGRSLNPDVRLEQRDEFWFYDDLAQVCGEHVAREIWDGWLIRNRLFHLFPGEKQHCNLREAEEKIRQFVKIIELCQECVRE